MQKLNGSTESQPACGISTGNITRNQGYQAKPHDLTKGKKCQK